MFLQENEELHNNGEFWKEEFEKQETAMNIQIPALEDQVVSAK